MEVNRLKELNVLSSLCVEEKDLRKKITNLIEFLESDKIENLSLEQKYLLTLQNSYMKKYHCILNKRINLLEEENPVEKLVGEVKNDGLVRIKDFELFKNVCKKLDEEKVNITTVRCDKEKEYSIINYDKNFVAVFIQDRNKKEK